MNVLHLQLLRLFVVATSSVEFGEFTAPRQGALQGIQAAEAACDEQVAKPGFSMASADRPAEQESFTPSVVVVLVGHDHAVLADHEPRPCASGQRRA